MISNTKRASTLRLIQNNTLNKTVVKKATSTGVTNAVKSNSNSNTRSQRRMYHVRGEMTSALLRMNALCFDIICAPIATDAMSSLAGSVPVSSDFDFESTLSFLWDKAARVVLTVLLGFTSVRSSTAASASPLRETIVFECVRIVFERLWWITTSGMFGMWRDCLHPRRPRSSVIRVSAASWETRVRSRARRAVTRSKTRSLTFAGAYFLFFPIVPAVGHPKNPYAARRESRRVLSPLRDETIPSTTRRRRRVESLA